MTTRLDGLYDTIIELEEKIEDAKLLRRSAEMQTITQDNIFKIILNFEKVYDQLNDDEKKALVFSLIKEIQIYPNEESTTPLKSISLHLPVYQAGEEVSELLRERRTTVSTCKSLSKHKFISSLIMGSLKTIDFSH